MACARSGLASERDEVVQVEQIEPGLHVLARFVEVTDALGKHLKRFHVAIRTAFGKVGAPLLDFPWAMFVRRVLLNPGSAFRRRLCRSRVRL